MPAGGASARRLGRETKAGKWGGGVLGQTPPCLAMQLPCHTLCRCERVWCRGGVPSGFVVPELTQLEVRNTTLRAPTQNSRGEWLPEWCLPPKP